MMPTYEYRCTRCKHEFEAVHAVGETVDRCDRCGGPVRRFFSVPALIFKGPGFHVNDYRKTPAPADGDGKAAGPAKPAKETKETKTSETKTPETKSSDSGSQGKAALTASEGKKAS
jgi:putative FmdB family regulatory protein